MAEGRSGTAAGGQLEERVDLTKETDAKLAQSQSLPLKEALALLGGLEKQCRIGNDLPNLVRVCEASMQLAKDSGDDAVVVQTLEHLASRRSQKTKAITALVAKCLPWVLTEKSHVPLAVTSDEQKESRLKLVVALRDITDGKLFLEAERARLTRALATIKEEDGDVAGAAEVLQDVHVETYGSLSKREKVEFILEQMRLTLAKQDFIRASIVSGKINRKNISEEGMEALKTKFFHLLTKVHRHEKDSFDLAKDYQSIYSTPTIMEDDAQWKEALQYTVLFLALSPYSNEQQDMMNRIFLDKNLEKIPAFRATLELLLKKEIINYPLAQQAELEGAIDANDAELASHWKTTLHTRIVQHNVRVASIYYKRIHGKRLASLLGLEPAVLEQEISNMVSEGSVYAKIDRPSDVVRFSAGKTPEAVLSDWASDISSLLHLVDSTTHLIHKENMTK
eukprot:scaffold11448_cov44-Attheya_sp.AAC.4